MAHFIYFWTFLLNMFSFVHVTFFRFLFFRVTLCCYCCGIKLERKINNYCCWCESLWVSYAFYGRRRHRCTSVSLSLFFAKVSLRNLISLSLSLFIEIFSGFFCTHQKQQQRWICVRIYARTWNPGVGKQIWGFYLQKGTRLTFSSANVTLKRNNIIIIICGSDSDSKVSVP